MAGLVAGLMAGPGCKLSLGLLVLAGSSASSVLFRCSLSEGLKVPTVVASNSVHLSAPKYRLPIRTPQNIHQSGVVRFVIRQGGAYCSVVVSPTMDGRGDLCPSYRSAGLDQLGGGSV